MRTNPNPSIKLLIKLLKVKTIDSGVIGFTIAPLFNACGRISDPNFAATILQKPEPLEEDFKKLIHLNEQRKLITKEQLTMAISTIEQQKLFNDSLIVVHNDFHHGIIGILASKIVDRYKKPTIVISKEGTGSARSVAGTGFSIVEAIKSCEEHLIKFGGHQVAAGLSILPKQTKIELFRKAIQKATLNQKATIPVISYTSELLINDFPKVLFDDFSALEPFGKANPKPLFFAKDIPSFSHNYFGKNNEHVRFHFSQNVAYGFFKGKAFSYLNQHKKIKILYVPHSYEKKDFLINAFNIM